MRYVYAIIASGVVIGGFAANHIFVSTQLANIERQARAQLGLAPDAPLDDVGVDVPSRLSWLIKVDHLFARLWFLLIPLVIAISFAISFASGRLKRNT